MKKYNKKEIVLVSLLILLLVFGFLLLTGTFNSAYHLVDDHEFVRILNDLKSSSLWDVLCKWVSESFVIRFRPLYFVIRVILTSIFGLHFKLWYTWKALEICGSAFFLYLFARNMKCNKIVSFLFPTLVLLGAQTAIWYRLGPQEATGLFFLSISLYFISEYCLYNKNKKNIIIASISIILMSLMKESYVLMIPPIVILKLTFDYCRKNNLKSVLKENNKFIALFLSIFIIEMFTIVVWVGLNKIGYAGFSANITTYEYLDGIKRSLLSDSLIPITLLFSLAIGIILANYDNTNKNHKTINIGFILFSLSIIILQLVLHARSTMFERYIVPMSIAYSFVIIILVGKILSKRKNIIIYFILIFIIITSLLGSAINNAKIFAKNGTDINNYLWYTRNNVTISKDIFIAMDYEEAYSTAQYLKYYDFVNLYEYEPDYNYSTLENMDKKPINEIRNEIDVIVMIIGYYDLMFSERYFNKEEFEIQQFGNYFVCIRTSQT